MVTFICTRSDTTSEKQTQLCDMKMHDPYSLTYLYVRKTERLDIDCEISGTPYSH